MLSPWNASPSAASPRRRRDIHKTALGAELTVPWTYHKTTEECIARLRAEGYRVYAVEQVEGAVMLGDFRAEPGVKYALVFGNEVMGVGQQAVDMCHGAIEIPQAGTKHSINVSVSGRCRSCITL